MAREDRLAIVRADGTAITRSGETVQTRFLRSLNMDLDDYSDLVFTPAEARRISAHITKLRTGSTAVVPLICQGEERCPFAARCPFAQVHHCPVGRQCLLEVQMLKHYLFQYMNEYQIDPESFTELSYCNELAEIEVYLWRINNNLAKAEYAELMIDQNMGADRNGNIITQKQISPLVLVKDKLLSRKSKIIKLMVGDRQEKYKKEAALKQKNDKDTSSIQAAARRKIEELKRKLDSMDTMSKEESDVLTPDAIINSTDEE